MLAPTSPRREKVAAPRSCLWQAEDRLRGRMRGRLTRQPTHPTISSVHFWFTQSDFDVYMS